MLQGRRDERTSPENSLPKEGMIVRTFTVPFLQFQIVPAKNPCQLLTVQKLSPYFSLTWCVIILLGAWRSSSGRLPRNVVSLLMFYTRRADVRIQHVEDEMLVLDDQNGFIHQLNHTASFVWLQCDGKSSLNDIVRRLAREFDLDEVVATKDVSEVLQKLRDLKLVCE